MVPSGLRVGSINRAAIFLKRFFFLQKGKCSQSRIAMDLAERQQEPPCARVTGFVVRFSTQKHRLLNAVYLI